MEKGAKNDSLIYQVVKWVMIAMLFPYSHLLNQGDGLCLSV